MTMWRVAARLGAVLVCATGWAALPAASAGAAPGFETAITEMPGQFVAGGAARIVTAVVSTSRNGGCLKVRWSMVLRADGLRLDQIGVDRIEETGSVPVDIQRAGAGARLTDRELDPGTLCRDRTVTARYRVAVDETVTDGQIVIAVEAYDAGSRLLDRQSATREVVREQVGALPSRRAPAPIESESARPAATSAAPAPTGSAETQPTGSVEGESPVLAEGPNGGAAEAGGSGAGRSSAGTGRGGTGLAELGFAVGGLLLFLGAGLLFRLRPRLAAETVSAPPPGRRDCQAGVWHGAQPAGRRRSGTARRYRDC